MPGYGDGPYGFGPYGMGGIPGRISWDDVSDRKFETGLDRGVLYTNSGLVVPWNGLTAVDETGGESANAYFLDGRPFLYLPKPKEFAATIKAYTYPDEFSTIMGVAEITDGMYLDSQMGDTFGLSYRTLIGDMLNGTDAGYKIHLIYNASVVPPSRSYGTKSDTINPMEFSWDIQAVPVVVAGYRPTAHVVIDTSHMDATRLAEIETLLYGSETVSASLPSPQDLFDILHFGSEIIITDHGDGTWSAEGSYHNVYIVEYGIFRIENADAVDNGDGTFTISSTI